MNKLNIVVSYINLFISTFIIYTLININTSITEVKDEIKGTVEVVGQKVIQGVIIGNNTAYKGINDIYKRRDSVKDAILAKSKIYQNLLKKR